MRILILALFLLSNVVLADTFDDVISIFETKCQSCHSGATPAGELDLTGSKDAIYDKIFEVSPTNSTAAQNGDKIVDAGYPMRSSIYKKINDGLYHDAELKTGEGSSMSEYGVNVDDWERELIRSWIYNGAKKTGNPPVGTKPVIQDYFDNGGIAKMEKPAEPENGFQLYCGSIFMEPDQEWEMVYKHELNNPEPLEITKIEVFMADFSHHFLFFEYLPNQWQDDDEGFREVGVFTGEIALTGDTKMISGWAYSRAFELPVGTAYKWDANSVLKFNYHIKNYSQNQVFPAELYINVHTQPVGTAIEEMHSDFLIDTNFFGTFIPANGEETVLSSTESGFGAASGNQDVHIWALAGHTHSLGVDYDIYLNDNGNKGEQVYEGMYDINYEFFTGVYDYAEPPFAMYDDYITIKRNDGLIQEAKYINNTGSLVGYGLTTEDEMMGFFTQYMVGDISELLEYQDSVANAEPPVNIAQLSKNDRIKLVPNPNNGLFTVDLGDVLNANIQVFDVTGRLVNSTEINNARKQTIDLQAQSNGVYFVYINVNGEQFVQKLLKN